MSGYVMVPGWLIDKQPSGNALLAYVNLAKRGTWNPGTGEYDECRPSMPTLAADMKVAVNTARTAVKELEALGGVVGRTRFAENGSQLPTVYRVVFGRVVEPPTNTPPPKSDRGGTPKSDRGVLQNSTGAPLQNPTDNQEPIHQEPNTKRKTPARASRSLPPSELASSFEEWYAAYPVKKAPGAAEKAYTKALVEAGRDRRVKSGEMTAAELLLAAAKSHANDPARDPRFTKHPATWLNQKCWLDERTPVPCAIVPAGTVEFNGQQFSQRSADALAAIQKVRQREADEVAALFADWAPEQALELEGAPW